MMRLLAHPLPPLPSASCLSFSVFLTREGVRGWARIQIIRPRECLALYKSFNTLCNQHLTKYKQYSITLAQFHPYFRISSYKTGRKKIVQHKLIHFWILTTSAVGPVDGTPDGSVVDVWPIISYKVLHCKKGYRFSRPQSGCHLPNSLRPGII
jgi:hypothetical protein